MTTAREMPAPDAATPLIGSLCSGYGGLDLGVQTALGGSVAWHAEVDPGAASVLTRHWPGIPNLGDISRARWTEAPHVCVLTAGFPCQDVSVAGRRAGLTANTRSGLWHHIAGAIAAIRPGLVVIENVRGLLSAPADARTTPRPCPWCAGEPALRALGAVLGSLADLGYDARWCVLRASDVGAPHRRERVFIAAWPAQKYELVTDIRPVGRDQLPARDPEEMSAPARWGRYAPAVARWERRTRPAPPATDEAGRLSPAFVEWMQGLPAGWVTDTPGLGRPTQLTILGNGVVPQQAHRAVRLMNPPFPACPCG
ncbi:DNA cytosine methyltransferase [Streptomyces carpaticus]|uniref:DNA (cytosine-5-)-methyltransferase n=1 Tax=Streptomyces carpaticus TaxID=285558 RepID=A0ABV4ZHA3_9ACTN